MAAAAADELQRKIAAIAAESKARAEAGQSIMGPPSALMRAGKADQRAAGHAKGSQGRGEAPYARRRPPPHRAGRGARVVTQEEFADQELLRKLLNEDDASDEEEEALSATEVKTCAAFLRTLTDEQTSARACTQHVFAGSGEEAPCRACAFEAAHPLTGHYRSHSCEEHRGEDGSSTDGTDFPANTWSGETIAATALLQVRHADDWMQVVLEYLGCLHDTSLATLQAARTALKAHMRLHTAPITLYEALSPLAFEWAMIAAKALRGLAQKRLFKEASRSAADGMMDGCGCFQSLPLEALLRSGASLLLTDDEGRVPAHYATSLENLAVLTQAAPSTLLCIDKSDRTPLDLLADQDALSRLEQHQPSVAQHAKELLAHTALRCAAALPGTTMQVLQQRSDAEKAWRVLSQVSPMASVLCGWSKGLPSELSERAMEAQEHEGALAQKLRAGMQRLQVLRALAEESAEKLEAMQPEECRLRLAEAEQALHRQREASAQKEAELEKEIRRLKTSLAKSDEELLAARCRLAELEANPPALGPPLQSQLEGRKQNGITLQAVQPRVAAACGGGGGEPTQAEGVKSSERGVVEEIRRARLVDVDLESVPSDLRVGLEELRSSLAAAADRLARDLYESEAHFVQELLQNADDNRYAPDVRPNLRLALRRSTPTEAGFFYAANNEVGLSDADVRALCDISRSSKSASSGSTTGYKGVGWKSVFRVCGAPHVLSNGWRFKFGAQGLGMLTPEWLEDSEYEALPAEVLEAHKAGNTVFYLPLADPVAASSIESEMRTMASDSAQILFLRRLREICLDHCSWRHVVRLTVGGAETGSSPQRVSAILREARGGSGGQEGAAAGEDDEAGTVETTYQLCTTDGVTVALPLVEEPPAQRIFAFLPVRAAGFRFAVQAPFHLTASRADLHRSPENTRRRNAVAPAFLEACSANTEVAARALKYLGTEPAEPFWMAVRTAIVEGLQKVKCVLTEDGPFEPQRCVLRGEDPVAAWVPESWLSKACGLRFASASNPREAMRDLGVRTFGFDELAKCLQHEGGQWLREVWPTAQRSAIFSDVYGALADALHADPSRLDLIQSLRLFPLASVGVGAADSPEPRMPLGRQASHPLPDCCCRGPGWRRLCRRCRPGFTTALSLHTGFCPDVPQAWQAPLIQCLSSELELTAHGNKLLQLLQVGPADEAELERRALQRLLALANVTNGVLPGHGQVAREPATWAALAVLRRCFLLGRTPPRPWGELRDSLLLPSISGQMLPPERLSLWSFLGVELKLPQPILDIMCAMVGVAHGRDCPNQLEMAATPLLEPVGVGRDWHLGWEVFLSNLGCVPLDPAGPRGDISIEVTTQLGTVLSSGHFWSQVAKSKPAIEYLKVALHGPPRADVRVRRRWLRRLPLRFNEDYIAVEDLFLHEEFHTLCGGHLPYVSGIPRDETVRDWLQWLGVSMRVDQTSLLKCLHWLSHREVMDVGLAADIYAKLDELGFAGPGDQALILVPGRGFLSAGECSWKPFKLSLLHKCRRSEPLSEIYGRFGPAVQDPLQRWVRPSPEEDAVELCDALLNAILCAKADAGNPHVMQGRSLVMPGEAATGLLAAAKFAVEALAKICCADEAQGNAAFNYFVQHRMIVVPPGDDEGDASCRLLHMGEAYWSVEPALQQTPCAAWALEVVYGAGTGPARGDSQAGVDRIRRFFTEVLRVPKVLTADELQRRTRTSYAPTPARPGHVQDGFDWSTIGTRQSAQVAPWSLDDALRTAYARAQHGPAPQEGPESEAGAPPWPLAGPPRGPRTWRLVGSLGGLSVFSVDGVQVPRGVHAPDMNLICRVAMAFGLHITQLAWGYDPSGRSVCTQRLYLDIASLPRAAQLPPAAAETRWAAELALAIAHQGTGPFMDERLFAVQAELLAQALPTLAQPATAAPSAAAAAAALPRAAGGGGRYGGWQGRGPPGQAWHSHERAQHPPPYSGRGGGYPAWG